MHLDTKVIWSRTRKQKTNSLALVRERTIPAERPPLLGDVRANFADRGCHVVSVTDLYGRILEFLEGIKRTHTCSNNIWTF
jgi:hypothetical protein